MLRIRGNAWAAAGGSAQMTMEAIIAVGRRWGEHPSLSPVSGLVGL